MCFTLLYYSHKLVFSEQLSTDYIILAWADDDGEGVGLHFYMEHVGSVLVLKNEVHSYN